MKTKNTKSNNFNSGTFLKNIKSQNIKATDVIFQQAGANECLAGTSKNDIIEIYDANWQKINKLVDVIPLEHHEPLKVLNQNTFKKEDIEKAMEVENEIHYFVDEDDKKSCKNFALQDQENVKPNILKLNRQYCCACDYVDYYRSKTSNWSYGWMKCIVCKNLACPTCATGALSCEFICIKCYGG